MELFSVYNEEGGKSSTKIEKTYIQTVHEHSYKQTNKQNEAKDKNNLVAIFVVDKQKWQHLFNLTIRLTLAADIYRILCSSYYGKNTVLSRT